MLMDIYRHLQAAGAVNLPKHHTTIYQTKQQAKSPYYWKYDTGVTGAFITVKLILLHYHYRISGDELIHLL
jgi:hypothetical protein